MKMYIQTCNAVQCWIGEAPTCPGVHGFRQMRGLSALCSDSYFRWPMNDSTPSGKVFHYCLDGRSELVRLAAPAEITSRRPEVVQVAEEGVFRCVLDDQSKAIPFGDLAHVLNGLGELQAGVDEERWQVQPASLVSSIVARLSFPPENETTAGSLNSATVSRTNLMASQMRALHHRGVGPDDHVPVLHVLAGNMLGRKVRPSGLDRRSLFQLDISSEDIFAVPVAKAKCRESTTNTSSPFLIPATAETTPGTIRLVLFCIGATAPSSATITPFMSDVLEHPSGGDP